ncbi:MAG: Holliday junction resolvase RuvX [Candidatus Velthaea sp.]
MRILGLDPGTRKCGFAVIDEGSAAPLHLGIAPLAQLSSTLERLKRDFAPGLVAIGKGTNAAEVMAAVTGLGLPFALVDERETTLRARARFFADHPPRGWRRLIPQGLLLPDRPVDDYAALLIAERYLKSPLT